MKANFEPDRPTGIRRVVRYGGIALLLIVAMFYAKPVWQAMQLRFEQTHIQQVLRQLTQACDGRFIEAIAMGQVTQLREALADNPVACLNEAGLSSWDYQGDYAAPTILAKGSWGFDTDRRVLVYRIQNTERVINLNPSSDELHFELRAEFADVNENDSQDGDEHITGLLIKSVHTYRWREAAND